MACMRRHNLKVLYVSADDVPTTDAIGKVLRKPLQDSELEDEVRMALAS
jgi:hypothetical protein